MKFSEDIYQQYPLAIEPIYSTGKPNQPINEPIKLYSGELEITQKENVYLEHGEVNFKWLPYPHIKFQVSNYNSLPCHIELGKKVCLNLVGIEASVECLLSRLNKISGILNKPVIFGSGQNLSYILFHLTNFHQFTGSDVATIKQKWCKRLTLQAGDWSVFIDSVADIQNIMGFLESQRGYAITHVGKLERSDKKPFAVKEAEDLLEALRWFITFTRGFWSAPILLVGYNSAGEKFWQKWNADKVITPWREVDLWFPTSQDAQSLNDLFPGFLRRWQNDTWKEPIKLAIHWYVESNAQAGGVPGSIVLMQAAFELLASTLLVEDKGIISEETFNKIPAADKLRLLLSQSNISLKVPDSLSKLLQAAQHKDLKWVDGAQALTEIRNAIVHANPKKRQRVLTRDFSEQEEAYYLGLWYLELILLNLFEYKGNYWNRIAKKQYYEDYIESVPWVKN